MMMHCAFGLLVTLVVGWLLLMIFAVFLWISKDIEAALKFSLRFLSEQLLLVGQLQDVFFTNHPRALLEQELAHLEGFLSAPFIAQSLTVLKEATGNGLSQLISDEHASMHVDKTLEIVKYIGINLWSLSVINMEIVLSKAFVLLSGLPCFVLSAILGFGDGLHRRAVRKAELGRESSFVFHRFSYHVVSLVFFILGLWVVLPIRLHPAVIFLPAGLLIALMAGLSASRFKKYL